MKALQAIPAFGAAILAVLGGLCIGLYGALVAVNLRDRPPSATALELEAAIAGLPAVSDDDNAFILALGANAPRDADPAVVGRAQAEWIREQRNTRTADSNAVPPGGASPPIEDPVFRSVSAACNDDVIERCFTAIAAGAESIGALLEENAWRLERYRALLARQSWRQLGTFDQRDQIPAVWLAGDTRLLYFLEAWRYADEGDASAVRARLENDLALWRMAARESDTLLGKMLATSYVGRHFRWSSVVLERLPVERMRDAIPPAWDEPFDADARSMRRAFAGELVYQRSMLSMLKESRSAYGEQADSREWSLDEHVTRRLLQPQDFLNRRAEQFAAYIAASELPFRELVRGLAAIPAGAMLGADERWYHGGHNLVGRLMLASESVDWGRYVVRVADLEGIRRAALLTAEVRARSVPPERVATEVAAHFLRNPYTEEPFVWDGARREVVFHGLEEAPRARHSFRL